MIAAEAQSQYSETLAPDLLAAHRANLSFLQNKIPPGYPEPYLPYGRLKDPTIDPPLVRAPVLNEGIVSLGHKLFFDPRLSFSKDHGFADSLSCASCHIEDRRFIDGEQLSRGVDGDLTRRNTPTLLNAAYNSTLTWANAVFPQLEMQALIPLFGDDPIEMGLKGKESELLSQIFAKDPEYTKLFQDVFHLDAKQDLAKGLIDYTYLTAAIAAYERTLIDFDTKFDRYLQGKLRGDETYADDEKLGLELFYGFKKLKSGTSLPCAQCHAGVMLSDSFHYVREGRYLNRKAFHNTGLYNLDGKGAYPAKNTGFANAGQLAKDPSLMGQFRTPPLRFVSLTAPYAHDGTQSSLEDVIRAYAAGGRSVLEGHIQNPFIDPLLRSGFVIDDAELSDLVKFLNTLR